MDVLRRIRALALPLLFSFCFLTAAHGQTGVAGLIHGTVSDSSGAVIPGASVTIHNVLSGYQRTETTDASGGFSFPNLAFGNYHMMVKQSGFQTVEQDIQVQSAVGVLKNIALSVASASQTVTVHGDTNDIVQRDVTDHTDIDNSMIERLPTESSSTGISNAITLASPGVAADSNGMFHPLGEHSDTTYSIDGQPISDQQSKTFSNQLSMNAVQSMQIIEGVIPAEYGDKASLVARTTTKSGLDNLRPTGSIAVNYGSFGTASADATMGVGTEKFGDFLDLNGSNSGRFLDSPEYVILHDRGNNESFFDRIDYAPTTANTYHLNLTGSRSWFQVPNQYDQNTPGENPYDPSAPGQDQRSEIFSYNVAPFWTHLIGQSSVLNVNPYLRQDNVHYYPSRNVFSDTPATLSQDRSLRNLGIKADYSLVEGINNAKFGFDVNHTFLTEGFAIGITSPTYNEPSSPTYQPGLAPYDLTRGGSLFQFHGHTDIKEETLYAQDQITLKQWQFLVGLRGDNYNGLSRKYMAEPRTGITYNVKATGTVLRVGYSRLMPTPYNENLILSSETGAGGLAQNVGAYGQHPLVPATRNQYDTGFEQSASKYLVIDGEYFWKETKDDYDFDVLLNTPLTFPIQWRKSKIDGFDLRATMPETHGLSAYSVMGHSRSRFFGPEEGGILFNNPNGLESYAPFRIDHDQAFEQTTHFQYQPKTTLPWYGFTWRYDSGLVAGAVPCYNPLSNDPNSACGSTSTTLNGLPAVDLSSLTADQEAQAGLECDGVKATPGNPLPSTCLASQLSSTRVRIPAPGTGDNDHNPPRIDPRNLIDMSAGWDNMFRRQHYKLDANFSVTNLTDKVALFNFLSTFSGTHFVPPRAYTAGLTFDF